MRNLTLERAILASLVRLNSLSLTIVFTNFGLNETNFILRSLCAQRDAFGLTVYQVYLYKWFNCKSNLLHIVRISTSPLRW